MRTPRPSMILLGVLGVLGVLGALAACSGSGADAGRTIGTSATTVLTSSTSVATTTTAAPSVEVRFEEHHPATTIGAPVCDDSGGCLYPFQHTSTASGDATGTATVAGAAATDPKGGAGVFTTIMTHVFTGTFASCGDGTVIMRTIESVDPATGAATGRWEIVPGVGSGSFVRLAGGGTIDALPSDPEHPGDYGAAYTGTARCDGSTVAAPDAALIDDPASGSARFHATMPAPAVSAPICNVRMVAALAVAAANNCLYPSVAHPTDSGDLAGTSVGAGVGWLVGDPARPGYVATSLNLFRGTVAGCGDGTMVVRSTAELVGMHLEQRWEIVPGYGSGALVGAVGSGTAKGEQATDHSYAVDGIGRIDCTG